jgi:hypothetical protein
MLLLSYFCAGGNSLLRDLRKSVLILLPLASANGQNRPTVFWDFRHIHRGAKAHHLRVAFVRRLKPTAISITRSLS